MQNLHTRNPLLVHDVIGKAPRTCYDLPGQDFVYGRASNPDLEGAREVTMHWTAHSPTKKECFAGPNFIALNKKSIQDKISIADARAKQERQQRSKVSKPLKTTENLISKQHITPMGPSFTYGKQGRPSTPIASVISCQYGAEEEIARNIDYQNYEAHKRTSLKQREVTMTKSMEGHASGAARRIAKLAEKECEPKEQFKLSKFKKIPARVGDTGLPTTDLPSKPAPDATPTSPAGNSVENREMQTEGADAGSQGAGAGGSI